MKNWKKYPLSIEYCDLNNSLIDSVISIDETGTPILNNRDVLFTLTGIMIKKEDINLISEKILCLKKKFWEHGQFKDKRVVFHSRDIRKKVGPYNPNIINYNVFIDELYDLILDIPFQCASATINKKLHQKKYIYPYPVYQLSMEFLLERFNYNMNNNNNKSIILLESRGKKEDQELLNFLVKLLEEGNAYTSFKNILGIYFNKKRTNCQKKSYWTLEIADLISYSIYSTIRNNKSNPLFEQINDKIIYSGIKQFP